MKNLPIPEYILIPENPKWMCPRRDYSRILFFYKLTACLIQELPSSFIQFHGIWSSQNTIYKIMLYEELFFLCPMKKTWFSWVVFNSGSSMQPQFNIMIKRTITTCNFFNFMRNNHQNLIDIDSVMLKSSQFLGLVVESPIKLTQDMREFCFHFCNLQWSFLFTFVMNSRKISTNRRVETVPILF